MLYTFSLFSVFNYYRNFCHVCRSCPFFYAWRHLTSFTCVLAYGWDCIHLCISWRVRGGARAQAQAEEDGDVGGEEFNEARARIFSLSYVRLPILVRFSFLTSRVWLSVAFITLQ